MKIEWLIADVTSVRSPARTKRDIFGVILNVSWPIQSAFVVEEPLCNLGKPLMSHEP